jgi:uncharacterized protein (TIGR02611 family)
MSAAGEPEHEQPLRSRLREAAIEAEYETGVREDTEEAARASIHIRLARMTVGTLVLVAGILLVPLPGPGWLTVAAGLAILAKDVAWAERALDRVRRRLPSDADGSVSTPVVMASVCFAVVTMGASVWWYLIR